MVLMHSFIAEGDRRAAFKVFQSMNAAGMDVQRGWLLLCKDCLRYGCGLTLKSYESLLPWVEAVFTLSE